MDFQNKSSYSLNSKAVTLIVLGILILVNIISVRYFLRFDWTRNDRYSISDATVSILQRLDDLVTVKAYFTDNVPPQILPVKQYVSDILSEYQAYGSGNFEYEFLDPAQDPEIAQEAQSIGIQQVSMRIREGDTLQVQDGYLGIGLFFEGKTEVISIVQQQNLASFEYDLTSLILRLTQERTPKIAFLQGHGEHDIGSGLQIPGIDQAADYRAVGQVLRQNYELTTVDLALQQTLDGIDVLVVAGPKKDLTERAIFEIDQFLLGGGKAIFLIDSVDQLPGSLSLLVLDTNAKTLLAPIGVTIESNILLDTISEIESFSEGPGRFFFLQYPPTIRLVSENFSEHPIVSKVPSFIVRFASRLMISEKEGLEYDRFINTSPNSWSQEQPFQLNPRAIPPPTPDQQGSSTVAITVSGLFPRLTQSENIPVLQKWGEDAETGEPILEFVEEDNNRSGREIITEAQAEAQIIVVSDSDFIVDTVLQQDQAGMIVFLNMIDYMTFGEELVTVRSKVLGGADIDELENAERALMKFLGILLVPILISGYGIFRLWIRRKEEKLLKL